MDSQFQRILDLVRRTGDRMVVTDSDGENAYVVMDLDQYEALVDMEEGFLDGMLEDDGMVIDDADLEIETTESASPFPVADDELPVDIWDAMAPAGADQETWDLERMDEAQQDSLKRQYEAYQQEKAQPSEETEVQAPNFIENQDDEDFGEEAFYLEPVE